MYNTLQYIYNIDIYYRYITSVFFTKLEVNSPPPWIPMPTIAVSTWLQLTLSRRLGISRSKTAELSDFELGKNQKNEIQRFTPKIKDALLRSETNTCNLSKNIFIVACANGFLVVAPCLECGTISDLPGQPPEPSAVYPVAWVILDGENWWNPTIHHSVYQDRTIPIFYVSKFDVCIISIRVRTPFRHQFIFWDDLVISNGIPIA